MASAVARHPLPDGFPGLREQLQAAKTALVFGPEDRAPHAVFFACGRSYATKLHNRLSEGGAFCLETRPPADVMAALAAFNTELGTQHRDRVPYLYGSWKAKKGDVQVDRRHITEGGKPNRPHNASPRGRCWR